MSEGKLKSISKQADVLDLPKNNQKANNLKDTLLLKLKHYNYLKKGGLKGA